MSEIIKYKDMEFRWDFHCGQLHNSDFIWTCYLPFYFSNEKKTLKLVVRQRCNIFGEYEDYSGSIFYYPNNNDIIQEYKMCVESVHVSIEDEIKNNLELVFKKVINKALDYIEEIKKREFDYIDLDNIKIHLDYHTLCQTCNVAGYKIIAYIDSLDIQTKRNREVLLPSKKIKYKIYKEENGQLLLEGESIEGQLDNCVLNSIKSLVKNKK